MPPNVLLIVFDAARADAFEPYGAPSGTTPVVSDLARRGAALPAAFAAASWTVPSHAALLSGLLPRATGLTQAPGGTPDGCRPRMEALRERLLPEVLRRNGYETRAVSTNLWLSPASGFDTGFDQFVTVDTGRQHGIVREGLRGGLRLALEAIRARADDGAAEAETVLLDWIEQPHRRPFFWFVNLVECHSPYLPPLPYNDLGALDRLRASFEARRHLQLDAIWRACAGGFDIPQAALERMRRLYRASIRALDDWLGHVLTPLDDRGLADETLVIVASDHGENLGEAGLIGHAFSLDDRLIRVPCVVAGPGAFDAPEASSLAALPRLIAESIGLDEHPWSEGVPPAGAAVAQFDPPTGPEDPRVEEAVARWGLGPEAAERITTRLSCATDGRHKLILRGRREELYDLDVDPLEVDPRDPNEAGREEVVAALREALDHPAARAEAPPAEPIESATASARELRDLEERMRLLGYM
jgi:hypothetical protein